MTKFIITCASALILSAFTGCSSDTGSLVTVRLSEARLKELNIPTVVDPLLVIAAYQEKESGNRIVFVYDDENKLAAKKITYMAGAPIMVEKLLPLKNSRFKLTDANMEYEINEKTITSVYAGSINKASMSYNWSCDNPANTHVIKEYPRMDIVSAN